MSATTVWHNARLATMRGDADAYGVIEDGAVAVDDGRIAWVGRSQDVPEQFDGVDTTDAQGCWITPGLIDCHTHLVYAGARWHEFELRQQGASYADIARAGGGIAATVTATRAASREELADATANRLAALVREGVTTVEVKSGYGLDIDTELRMLQAAIDAAAQLDRLVDLRLTFLGAHALPPEYSERPDDYIDFVCRESLPAVAAAIELHAVDAFCENIAFNTDQTRRVFEAARSLDLPVKLHAEQLSDQGGTELAANFGALSVDHLEYVSDRGIDAIADSGTVAVLLPGAFYFLRETQLPPVERLRERGVPIALASDSNPGSSPFTSLLLMLNMGCVLFGLTPEEALAGVTRNAALALGLGDEAGTLEAGKRADFVVWDLEHPAQLAAQFGANACRHVISNGVAS